MTLVRNEMKDERVMYRHSARIQQGLNRADLCPPGWPTRAVARTAHRHLAGFDGQEPVRGHHYLTPAGEATQASGRALMQAVPSTRPAGLEPATSRSGGA